MLGTIYLYFYDKVDDNFRMITSVGISISAACINLAFILVMNQVYDRLAMKLTEMECPRIQSDFDNRYT